MASAASQDTFDYRKEAIQHYSRARVIAHDLLDAPLAGWRRRTREQQLEVRYDIARAGGAIGHLAVNLHAHPELEADIDAIASPDGLSSSETGQGPIPYPARLHDDVRSVAGAVCIVAVVSGRPVESQMQYRMSAAPGMLPAAALEAYYEQEAAFYGRVAGAPSTAP